MIRILVTGMSGTGKSSVIRELSARGHRAYDLDSPEWSEWVDASPADNLTPAQGKDWLWRLDRVRALLSETHSGPLFISGCAENMSQLYPLIDTIILLSAPVETIQERVATRSPGNYGHTAAERQKIAALIETIEPRLRERTDHEIDTRKPVSVTADEILKFVQPK